MTSRSTMLSGSFISSAFRWLVALLVMAGLILAWASVNIFPLATNDSLAYLRHADDLRGGGVVQMGYRQVGYPAFIALIRGVADAFRGDSLLWLVVAQRLLLAASLGYLVWLVRWWSLPLVALVALPSFIVYSNTVLTEGLGLPLAILLAGLLTHAEALTRTPTEDDGRYLSQRRKLLVLGPAVSIVAGVLVTVRFTYAALGIAPLALAAASWTRAGRRRPARAPVWSLVLFLLFGAAFTVALSLENRGEYGEFSPSTRTMRTQYWAAWEVVFTLHGDAVDHAALEEYWDGGSPYPYIEVVETDSSVARQAARFERRIDELFDSAGLERRQQQRAALLGALRGGRIDDLESIARRAAQVRRGDLPDAVHRNRFSRAHGHEAFEQEFNRGRPIGAIITDRVIANPPVPYFGRLLKWLLPLSILVSGFGLTRARSRLLAGAALAPPIVLALAAGATVADNTRFLLVTSVWCIAMAGPVARAWFSSASAEEVTGGLPDTVRADDYA